MVVLFVVMVGAASGGRVDRGEGIRGRSQNGRDRKIKGDVVRSTPKRVKQDEMTQSPEKHREEEATSRQALRATRT